MNNYKVGAIYEIIFPEENNGRVICSYKGRVNQYDPETKMAYHDFKALTNYQHTAYFWLTDIYIVQARIKIRELEAWEVVLEALNGDEFDTRYWSVFISGQRYPN